LVTSQQYNAPGFVPVLLHRLWIGPLAVLGGFALIAAAVIQPGRALTVLAHALASAAVLVLGYSAGAAGAWAGAIANAVPARRTRRLRPVRRAGVRLRRVDVRRPDLGSGYLPARRGDGGAGRHPLAPALAALGSHVPANASCGHARPGGRRADGRPGSRGD